MDDCKVVGLPLSRPNGFLEAFGANVSKHGDDKNDTFFLTELLALGICPQAISDRRGSQRTIAHNPAQTLLAFVSLSSRQRTPEAMWYRVLRANAKLSYQAQTTNPG
jgi:hypothetical protein